MRRAFLLAALISGGFCGLEGTLAAQGCDCPFPFWDVCRGSAGAYPPTICPGQSVVLATGPARGSCLWSPSEGVTDPLACRTTAQPSHTTQYTVIYTEAYGGCPYTLPVTVVVLPPAPAPTITAPASATPGEVGLKASVPLHEGTYFQNAYEWTIFNGEITSGQGTSAITFSAAQRPVAVDGSRLGVRLSVVEKPYGTCPSEEASTTITLGPVRNPRAIPFR
jgi:hypothetical protein